MLSLLVRDKGALQALASDRHVPFFEGWHVWTVTIPRRSITGRLVWGTVWRRRKNGRWIYKQYVERPDAIQRKRAVRALLLNSQIVRPSDQK